MTLRPSRRLLQGTVDLLILKTLSLGPSHGYGVSSWLRQQTEGELGLKDAALYQALHRLENQKLIASDWGRSENNRRAKYYQLTQRGRDVLHEESGTWRRYAAAVFRVLDVEASP